VLEEAEIGSDVAVLAAAVVVVVAGSDEPTIGCVKPATSVPPFLSQGFGGETIAGVPVVVPGKLTKMDYLSMSRMSRSRLQS